MSAWVLIYWAVMGIGGHPKIICLSVACSSAPPMTWPERPDAAQTSFVFVACFLRLSFIIIPFKPSPRLRLRLTEKTITTLSEDRPDEKSVLSIKSAVRLIVCVDHQSFPRLSLLPGCLSRMPAYLAKVSSIMTISDS